MTWHDTSYHPIPPNLTLFHLMSTSYTSSCYYHHIYHFYYHCRCTAPHTMTSPLLASFTETPLHNLLHPYRTTTIQHTTLYYTAAHCTILYNTLYSALLPVLRPSLTLRHLTPHPLPHSIRHDTINPISYQIDEIISNQLK